MPPTDWPSSRRAGSRRRSSGGCGRWARMRSRWPRGRRLGERATADDVAAVAGLAHGRLGAGAGPAHRRRGRISGRAFVHPLVRAAVLDAVRPASARALHRRPRCGCASAGAPGGVAPHWQAAEPAGDERAVADLRAAAREAAGGRDGPRRRPSDAAHWRSRRGGPSRCRCSSSASSRSARSAPTARSACARLLREGLAGDAGGTRPRRAANHLVHADPAPPSPSSSRPSRTPPTRRCAAAGGRLLEALLFVDHERLRERIARAAQDAASLAALAAAANDGALRGMPTSELVPLAERALAGGELLASVGPRARPGTSSRTRCASPRTPAAPSGAGGRRPRRRASRACWRRRCSSSSRGATGTATSAPSHSARPRSRGGLEAIQGQGMVTTAPALSAGRWPRTSSSSTGSRRRRPRSTSTWARPPGPSSSRSC